MNKISVVCDQSKLVVPGLVPGIHAFRAVRERAWMPTDLVRGLKAYGTGPAKTIKRVSQSIFTTGFLSPDSSAA